MKRYSASPSPGPRIAGRVLGLIVAAVALLTLDVPLASAQSCRWDGTAPLCDGSCRGNESELTRVGSLPDFWVAPFVTIPPFGANCATGSKALCCVTHGRTCRWDGTAPFCEGKCRPGEAPSTPPQGSSSGAACVTGSKVYCCTTGNVGTTRQPLVARNCSSGPGTCTRGYVWREARANDRVCVTPQVRQQTRNDNAQARQRRSPTGGPSGPDTCRSGFVWREAFAGDHVCVTPKARQQAAQDNHWAGVRNACP
jgi:hypothetical protein